VLPNFNIFCTLVLAFNLHCPPAAISVTWSQESNVSNLSQTGEQSAELRSLIVQSFGLDHFNLFYWVLGSPYKTTSEVKVAKTGTVSSMHNAIRNNGPLAGKELDTWKVSEINSEL
jgi:hypothetical protein